MVGEIDLSMYEGGALFLRGFHHLGMTMSRVCDADTSGKCKHSNLQYHEFETPLYVDIPEVKYNKRSPVAVHTKLPEAFSMTTVESLPTPRNKCSIL